MTRSSVIFCVFLFLNITTLCGGNSESDSENAPIWHDTVFVIMSQPDQYHTKKTEECRRKLQESFASIGLESVPIVAIDDEEIPYHGAWTIFPVIFHLGNRLKFTSKWVVFLSMDSEVNLEVLENVLKNHQENHFIGYALADKDHTIIHHFSEPNKLRYPHFGASFIMSGSLISEISVSMAEHGRDLDWLPKDFSIDAQYELAKGLIERNERHALKHEPLLCLKYEENCAIYPVSDNCNANDENTIALSQKVLFAVKTCKKYHDERLPIIKKTWAEAAPNIKYFSEVTDPKVGTIQLEGVENTERGHCQKTMEIIKHFHKIADDQGLEWLVIADDDTILSVAKMMSLLLCFDPNADDIHMGQRYGYRVAFGRHGYDYVTGGGGMVFSRKMVTTMVKGRCECGSPDSPDDMHLGMCMAKLGMGIKYRFYKYQNPY